MFNQYLARRRQRPAASMFLFIISLFTFSPFCISEANAVTNSECYVSTISESPSVNAVSLENFLDCLATARPLSLAGAQWMVLRKSHWRLGDAAAIGSATDFTTRFASNPGDPNDSHRLYLNLRGLSGDRASVRRYVNTLEQEIFPKALRGFTDEPAANRTAVSFAATAHHFMAFADYAMGTWKRKYGRESKNNHYPGTLAVSNLFSDSWYDRAKGDFPYIAPIAPEGNTHWDALRGQYERFSYCEETLCFTRQERKVIQGLLFTLGNPDFVEAVHFTRHKGFGSQRGAYAGRQESLPQSYGCLSGTVFDYITTGWQVFEYSGVNYPEAYLDLSAFGKWGLLGRTIYLEAINKNDIRKTGFPGQFQGQNSVVREITDRAVADFKRLGGFGDERMDEFASPGEGDNSAAIGSADRAQAKFMIDNKMSGVSKLIAQYHYDRYEWEKNYVARKKAANPGANVNSLWGEAVAASLSAFADHPVNTSPFFTETIITKGWSMKFWVNLLHQLNPPAVYFVFMNVLGLRPKEAYFNGWDTYYDRVLFVLENNYLPSLNL